MIELNKIYFGKCDDVLKTFENNSFDSCVTDPPYGISFMNKHWDYDVPKVELWKEVFRVLKPGGHMLVACGTRTQHRMAVNIEDAGFEIRDVITWHYGSGFPKSMDISKAIDKAAGAEREVTGIKPGHEQFANRGNKSSVQSFKGTLGGNGGFDRPWMNDPEAIERYHSSTAPSTDEAKQWEGWGTALKPATEFWTFARKPISENTVAENVLKHGTGGINIDGSRIETNEEITNHSRGAESAISKGKYGDSEERETHQTNGQQLGRFPANVILDEFTGKILDEQTGTLTSGLMKQQIEGGQFNVYGKQYPREVETIGDSGGASRFFYCPKADNYERNKGLNGFDEKFQANANFRPNHLEKALEGDSGKPHGRYSPRANNHPTVKPIDLMRYLVKLITPKKGIVLDPFCGSGTTCIGAKLELINYVGIEMVEDYCKIAEARVAAWNPQKYIEQKLF